MNPAIDSGTSSDHFVHPNAICESQMIGQDTRIWAFAHVLPGAVIGAECNICDGVFIENDVRVGDRVTIKNGVQLWDGISIEDDVFIGPNATFTNDPFPRSKNPPEEFPRTIIRSGASIGANATILPDITVGQHAMVGAGAVVTQSIPPKAIAVGNPAHIIGYVDTIGARAERTIHPGSAEKVLEEISTAVKGVVVQRLPEIHDIRGDLTVGEYEKNIPFLPKRYFTVTNVPTRETRGAHAHRTCEQFLVCLQGSCALVVDDSQNREELVLDRPTIGVYIPAMTWGIQYKFSADAILLVLASKLYDPDDYIRDYQDFLAEL